LWQIKVRRATGEPKYVAVRGGHPVLYGADWLQGHAVLVLAEGEFDALLLWQEAGGLVDVATLGACSKRPGLRALPYLLPYGRILLAFDADAPDRRGVRAGDQAAERLAALSPRMRRLAVPSGKDATEYHQRGGRLRDWVGFALLKLDAEAGRLDVASAAAAALAPAEVAEPEPLPEVCARCDAPVDRFWEDGEPLCEGCYTIRLLAEEG
jgi:hypothetical protein